ncbi:hypothetical protein TELCIR_20212 [Teladorsagia circumcincta]|uniref:Uncharacterized protein n=1 Tax=Teladorsagia circumcincta TaxID=45464 RepID=A0A2G9TKA4_TELCI|nr:hypothetical protein TELCIR_20212 [Teladorsagia circumcincta]
MPLEQRFVDEVTRVDFTILMMTVTKTMRIGTETRHSSFKRFLAQVGVRRQKFFIMVINFRLYSYLLPFHAIFLVFSNDKVSSVLLFECLTVMLSTMLKW